MGKITDLLRAVGLTPGKKALRGDLHYGHRIAIATDADYDGDNIFTLLINLFYQWPELFDPTKDPIIYRMVAPNVCLVKGKQRIHFARRSDYEKVKDKYKGYEVNYYKGLGSMSKADWDICLAENSESFIPIVDDGHMQETLTLLFSDDADARKMWLKTVE
jgi:DNA gyrase/topoisomerase IV subunit B